MTTVNVQPSAHNDAVPMPPTLPPTLSYVTAREQKSKVSLENDMLRKRYFHVEAAGMITTVLKWRHQQTHRPFPLHLVRGMEVFFTILDARDRPVP